MYDMPTKTDLNYVVRWGLFWILVITILAIGANLMGVFGSAATAPGRVVSKTLETNNIISNYEWFYDANAQYQSRLGQIRSHQQLIAAERDAGERSRLNIDLGAMRQSCRELATKYNANSEKANKSLFKSRALPETISINDCDH